MTITLQKDELLVTGDLTQDTVMGALEQCLKIMPSNQKITVNLSSVRNCDSASLAFLTALMRAARQKVTQLHFAHLPKQMIQLSRVCSLETVLPMADS